MNTTQTDGSLRKIYEPKGDRLAKVVNDSDEDPLAKRRKKRSLETGALEHRKIPAGPSTLKK